MFSVRKKISVPIGFGLRSIVFRALYSESRLPTLRKFSTETPDSNETLRLKLDKELHIVFTCKVCETRSIKGFSRNSYENGVVLAKCPGCNNFHLIADNLGYFQTGHRNIVDILKAEGKSPKMIKDVLEITPEDLIGEENIKKVADQHSNDSETNINSVDNKKLTDEDADK